MIVAMTSGKGGTGKSCVAAYTGAAFAKEGKKVILIEMGADARSLDLILGAQNDILFDFSDVVQSRCDVKKAVVQTAYDKNLYLLPGSPLPFSYKVDISWYRSLLDYVSGVFDIVILDGVDFHSFPPELTDTILMVISPESLAIRSSAMQARGLYGVGADNLRLVINNVSPQVMPMYGARDFDDIIDTIGAQLIAVIPESPILQYSSNNAQQLDKSSLTVKVFDNLAQRLSGEHPVLLVK